MQRILGDRGDERCDQDADGESGDKHVGQGSAGQRLDDGRAEPREGPEPEHDARDGGEDLDHRLQDLARARCRVLAQVDPGAEAERCRNDHRHPRDDERPDNDGREVVHVAPREPAIADQLRLVDLDEERCGVPDERENNRGADEDREDGGAKECDPNQELAAAARGRDAQVARLEDDGSGGGAHVTDARVREKHRGEGEVEPDSTSPSGSARISGLPRWTRSLRARRRRVRRSRPP